MSKIGPKEAMLQKQREERYAAEQARQQMSAKPKRRSKEMQKKIEAAVEAVEKKKK